MFRRRILHRILRIEGLGRRRLAALTAMVSKQDNGG